MSQDADHAMQKNIRVEPKNGQLSLANVMCDETDSVSQ